MEIKNCTAEPNGLSSAKVIEVIETTEEVGHGTPGDPFILVHKYWSLDGKLLGVRSNQ